MRIRAVRKWRPRRTVFRYWPRVCVCPAPRNGSRAMAVAPIRASARSPTLRHCPRHLGDRVWSKLQPPSGNWCSASHRSARATAKPSGVSFSSFHCSHRRFGPRSGGPPTGISSFPSVAPSQLPPGPAIRSGGGLSSSPGMAAITLGLGSRTGAGGSSDSCTSASGGRSTFNTGNSSNSPSAFVLRTRSRNPSVAAEGNVNSANTNNTTR